MSVQTQISRITDAVGAAYDAVTAKGGTTAQCRVVGLFPRYVRRASASLHSVGASFFAVTRTF